MHRFAGIEQPQNMPGDDFLLFPSKQLQPLPDTFSEDPLLHLPQCEADLIFPFVHPLHQVQFSQEMNDQIE
ncbi:hypothetical protein D3C87_1870540 [compost metagenome]